MLIDRFGRNITIVTGGANGVDSIAEYIAKVNNIRTEIITPDFSIGYDVKQYFIRNDKIIDESDLIIAVWNGSSHGTRYVIQQCKNKNKKCEVIPI